MAKRKVIWLFLGVLGLSACGVEDRSAEERFSKIEIKEEVELPLLRLDKDFLTLKDGNVHNGLVRLSEKYTAENDSVPSILEIYTTAILNCGEPDSMYTAREIEGLFANKGYQMLLRDVDSAFVSLDAEKKKMDKAFGILHANIPELQLPKRYATIMSGFYANIACTMSDLCIGLDFYMGKDYQLYNAVEGINYDYRIQNFRRERMASDAVYAWLKTEYDESEYMGGNELLSAMIYQGKLMFMTSAACPDILMRDIIGFTKEQWEWCEHNEDEMWHYLAENKHLFSTDRLTISKYINEAPTTSFFPSDSPGRCGVYVGYRIVSAYMRNNPEKRLGDLFEKGMEARKVLEESGYNP